MNDIESLVAEMKREAISDDSSDDDLFAQYETRIRSAGFVQVLTQVFLSVQSVALLNILNSRIRQVWHELSYPDYLSVLNAISHHYGAIYGFVIFSGHVLDVDACALIRDAHGVAEVAKEYVTRNFKNGSLRGDATIAEDVLGAEFSQVWDRFCTASK